MGYEYEWDAIKSRRNLAKHGVPFEAVNDFDWSRSSAKEDQRHDYGETRFIAVGPIEGRLHVLVFTWRGEKIRVIGLRKANERERIRHESAQEA